VIGYEEGTTWSTGALASRFEVVRLSNTGHLYRCRIYYSARNVQSGVRGKSKIWDFRPFETVSDALLGEIAGVGVVVVYVVHSALAELEKACGGSALTAFAIVWHDEEK